MKIIANKIQCKNCGDVIESKFRHHFVMCSCGDTSVDGGTDYLKRSYRTEGCYIELSECQ